MANESENNDMGKKAGEVAGQAGNFIMGGVNNVVKWFQDNKILENGWKMLGDLWNGGVKMVQGAFSAISKEAPKAFDAAANATGKAVEAATPVVQQAAGKAQELATSAVGAVGDGLKSVTGGDGKSSSVAETPANKEAAKAKANGRQ